MISADRISETLRRAMRNARPWRMALAGLCAVLFTAMASASGAQDLPAPAYHPPV